MRLTPVAFSYFKKYVQREIAKATGVAVYKPVQGWREVRKKRWYYDENRPWTDAAKSENLPNKFHKPVLIEPIADEEWTVFKGDRVSKLLPSVDIFLYSEGCVSVKIKMVVPALLQSLVTLYFLTTFVNFDNSKPRFKPRFVVRIKHKLL